MLTASARGRVPVGVSATPARKKGHRINTSRKIRLTTQRCEKQMSLGATRTRLIIFLRGARRRAKRKGIPFEITAADIERPEFCPVLGLRLVYGASGKSRRLYENGAAASLDRIKNERGYVKNNVLIVSLRANLLKGQASIAELQKIAAFYARFK